MSLRDFKYDYYRYTGSHQVKIGEILKRPLPSLPPVPEGRCLV